jgi:hypothetical protein
VKTIGEVDIFPRNDAGNVGKGFPVNFTIQVATNSGGPWTTVVTGTSYPIPSNIVQWFGFTPLSGQYVKIEGTSLRLDGTEYRMQFAEVEIYSSPNFARISSIINTSSLDTTDFGASRVNDQKRSVVSGSAGWSSNNSLATNHTESITFNMQAAKTISRVDLYPRNDFNNIGVGFPVNFTVQVASAAGGPWTTVVTQTAYPLPNPNVQSFSFAATSAQYVKVEGTSLRLNGTEYRMQFAEVEIH